MEYGPSSSGEATGPIDWTRLELLSAFFEQEKDELRRALEEADAAFERTGEAPDLNLHFSERSWDRLKELAACMHMTDEQVLNEVLFVFQAIDFEMNGPAHGGQAHNSRKQDLGAIAKLLREPKLRSFFAEGLRQMHEYEKTGKTPPNYLLHLPLISNDIAVRAQQVMQFDDANDALTDLLRLKYDITYKD